MPFQNDSNAATKSCLHIGKFSAYTEQRDHQTMPQSGRFSENKNHEKKRNCHPKSQRSSHGDLEGQVRENHGNEVVKIVIAFDYKR